MLLAMVGVPKLGLDEEILAFDRAGLHKLLQGLSDFG